MLLSEINSTGSLFLGPSRNVAKLQRIYTKDSYVT